jgi:hypothetical protein
MAVASKWAGWLDEHGMVDSVMERSLHETPKYVNIYHVESTGPSVSEVREDRFDYPIPIWLRSN